MRPESPSSFRLGMGLPDRKNCAGKFKYAHLSEPFDAWKDRLTRSRISHAFAVQDSDHDQGFLIDCDLDSLPRGPSDPVGSAGVCINQGRQR